MEDPWTACNTAREREAARQRRRDTARRLIDVAAVCAIAGAIVVTLTCPAEPQTWPNRMSLAPGNWECFATVRIENRAGIYNRVETISTQHGSVSIKYETVGGHNATDHDRITVEALPDGIVAVPMEMEIPDGDTGTVCLMQYLGG